MTTTPTSAFSKATFEFLLRASRQKNPDWLHNHKDEFVEYIGSPLKNLASTLKRDLQTIAPAVHFPQKGIGRLKRPSHRSHEGGGLYKDWLTYTAARPPESRFEKNPSLFFLIQPKDQEDPVLLAGGLYMPSSRQVRAIREAIAQDATPFEILFKSKEFKNRFSGGFCDEKISSRPPRGFDPNHSHIDWLKLQAFFVWRSYDLKEFSSKSFAKVISKDCREILKLNELLDSAISGLWPPKKSIKARPSKRKKEAILDRLEDLSHQLPEADF